MISRTTFFRALPAIFWVLALATIPIWGKFEDPTPGWDLHVYANAIHSLQAGRDPYSDGIAIQRAFHSTPQAHDPHIMPPYTYVYSPLTLPLLKAIGHIPFSISAPTYWLLFFIGMLTAVWAGFQAVRPQERLVFALLAPAAIFFPGLIQNDVLFSGNIAYILYGLVLVPAVWGWRRDRWTAFYLATLSVSVCKAPLLTLLAIPLLTARRQWIPAGITAVLGTALFVIQPILWPAAMRHYLQAVNLQFVFNHDFGFSPAGTLGDILCYFHQPYSAATTIFYFAYALPLLVVLLFLAHRFQNGDFTLQQWIPVMLLGVILLDPRIKEYDVAPLALPMMLIVWRFFSRGTRVNPTLASLLFFAFVNVFVARAGNRWRPTECILLVGLFLAGTWDLLQPSSTRSIIVPELNRERQLTA